MAQVRDNFLLNFAIHSNVVDQIAVSLSYIPFGSHVGHGVDNKLGITEESMGPYDSWIMIR